MQRVRRVSRHCALNVLLRSLCAVHLLRLVQEALAKTPSSLGHRADALDGAIQGAFEQFARARDLAVLPGVPKHEREEAKLDGIEAKRRLAGVAGLEALSVHLLNDVERDGIALQTGCIGQPSYGKRVSPHLIQENGSIDSRIQWPRRH